MNEIPIGTCQCGCGQPTTIATRNSTRDNMVKGQPMRIIRGHAMGKYETDRTIAAYKDLQCRRRYKAEAKARCKAFVAEWLKTHPCVDCGETDPIVLDFDHRNPAEKTKTISQIIWNSHGIRILETEIAKCDVRCSNCHRRKTYRENEHYKTR